MTIDRTRRGDVPTIPASKALGHVLFAENEVSKVPGLSAETPTRSIRTAAVVGFGTMGRGIAMCFANAGIPVAVLEADQAAVERGTDAIRKTYDRSPSELRGRRRGATAADLCLRLSFRPPYDWRSMLDYLSLRATPGVEAVSDGHYRRSFSLGDSRGILDVELDAKRQQLVARVRLSAPTALIEIADRMKRAVRGVDLVCRYGGEEFAAILPGASLRDVAMIVERLRVAIEESLFDLSDVPEVEQSLPVTISIGGAVLDAETADVIASPGLLVKAADKALYAAKGGGRNCVRLFRLDKRSSAA